MVKLLLCREMSSVKKIHGWVNNRGDKEVVLRARRSYVTLTWSYINTVAKIINSVKNYIWMKILFLISKVFEQKFELQFLCQIGFLTMKLDFNTVHTDAKFQYLSKNSILMKSTPTLILNFPTKTGIIDNLIFLTKIGILPQCAYWCKKRCFKNQFQLIFDIFKNCWFLRKVMEFFFAGLDVQNSIWTTSSLVKRLWVMR